MIKAVQDERVLTVNIDIPPVNVLDTRTLNGLATGLGSLNPGIGAVLLRGAGKCFSAGASVAEHSREQAPAMLEALAAACLALQNAPVPVVALVHGSCFGGALELITFCDFVVADPGATFGVPEIQLAFFPPLACCQLAKQCGRQNAANLVLTGASLDANEAQTVGLVQQILPVDDWGTVSSRFNRLSLPVLRLAKQAFNMGCGTTSRQEIEELNRLFIEGLYSTEDVFEGINSFTEKRRPEWKHR